MTNSVKIHLLWQGQTPQKIDEVVSQGKQLQPDLIVIKIMTRKPCQFQCIFTSYVKSLLQFSFVSR
jgi:hypothetical protein